MDATAFILGARTGPAVALTQIARQIGFINVSPFEGISKAATALGRTPLIYFLFAPQQPVAEMKAAAQAIRSAKGRAHGLRYMPMVALCETAAPDDVSLCLDLGFDDLITLPFKPERIQKRLKRLGEGTFAFNEGPTYCGPARNIADEAAWSLDEADDTPTSVESVRVTVTRRFETGVSVQGADRNAA
jgi:hypothetical protein